VWGALWGGFFFFFFAFKVSQRKKQCPAARSVNPIFGFFLQKVCFSPARGGFLSFFFFFFHVCLRWKKQRSFWGHWIPWFRISPNRGEGSPQLTFPFHRALSYKSPTPQRPRQPRVFWLSLGSFRHPTLRSFLFPSIHNARTNNSPLRTFKRVFKGITKKNFTPFFFFFFLTPFFRPLKNGTLGPFSGKGFWGAPDGGPEVFFDGPGGHRGFSRGAVLWVYFNFFGRDFFLSSLEPLVYKCALKNVVQNVSWAGA